MTSTDRPRPKRRRSTPRRRRVHRLLLVLGFTVVLGVLGATAAFAIGYALTPIPDPNKLVTSNTSILYFDDGEEVLGSFAAQNRISVSLDQVPQHIQDAILAAENRTFWSDPGISFTGIARAGWAALTGGHVQGGSTITQQYVKNYYLTHEQTISRKINELFITIKLERQLSKAEILQNYLNTIYFGRGAYGIETAAQAYFGKSVHELTPAQGAVLAAVARAPSNYDPAVDEDNESRLEGRFAYVMEGLAAMGSSGVSVEEAREAKVPKLRKAGRDQQFAGPRGYLLQQVRRELRDLGYTDQEIDAGGLRVTTTFDAKVQQAAETAVEQQFPTENTRGVRAGLAAVRPGTGELVAIYGGRDYLERSFNAATMAKVEPGSTFKIFALAAALESGVSLTSTFDGNSGLEVEDEQEGEHEVNNEGEHDYGSEVDLLEATEKSINTAYVDMTVNELGPGKVVDAAVRAGVPEDSPGLAPVPLVPLGNAAVTPVDMANAYATFAAGGRVSEWHVVSEVTTRTGEVLYSADPRPERVFGPDVVSDVTYALQQVVEDGTGEAAAIPDRVVAGKTGNHEGRTAWFAGYTPQLATSVAFYRENKDGDRTSLDGVGGMSAFTGGGFPARTWSAFMAEALEGEPVERFPEPAQIGLASSPTPVAPPTVAAVPARPSPTPTPTPTETPTATPTETPTDEPTDPPTKKPPPTPTPTVTLQPTPTPTDDPTIPTPEPTETDDDDEPGWPPRRGRDW